MNMIRNDLILINDDISSVNWDDLPTPQAIVTSPPYWAKRSYPINSHWWHLSVEDCEHEQDEYGYCKHCFAWFGQLGGEPTPEAFIENLMLSMAPLPLRDDGVMWVNIDDTWIGGGGKFMDKASEVMEGTKQTSKIFLKDVNAGKYKAGEAIAMLGERGHKNKDLALVPEMFAIAMKKYGYYIRSKVIWEKTNGLPSSVLDRPQHFYENLFLFSKSRKYFYNKDAVTVPIKESTITRSKYKLGESENNYSQASGQSIAQPRDVMNEWLEHERGLRDVWSLPTASAQRESHIAPMPEKLVERCILLSTKEGDWVLDPFVGSGTVAKVAIDLGRRAIGVDKDNTNFEKLSKIQANLLAV